MLVTDAQREMRTVYRGGLAGQIVSGLLWFASAAAMTWSSRGLAWAILVLGGFFICPLTVASLKLIRGRGLARRENPLNALAMQVAFTVPLLLPVVLALSVHDHAWFYPAIMMVLGAHYLAFITIYGMRFCAVLAALLLGGGFALGYRHELGAAFGEATGAWLTGIVLIVFAFIGWRLVVAEERHAA